MISINVEDVWEIEVPGTGYAGWPTLAKSGNGNLHIVYSGGRRHHVCPFGQVHYLVSQDEGKSWTWPRVLVDSAIDDRDAGVLPTSKGSLIVNWFSSLTWEMVMQHHPDTFNSFSEAEQAEWRRRHALLNDEVRQAELGVWAIRSTDGGASWSQKIPTKVGSPHGPCELSDGRLLYVGKKVAKNFAAAESGAPYNPELGAAESSDDGQSWQVISDIPTLDGHEARAYHELHAVEAGDGTIIAHIRNHNDLYRLETLQTESHDGGRTWNVPHPIGLWGFPAFLMRAADGRLLTTIGHRREPNGNRVAVSEDNGKSWSQSAPINTDSSGDFGYPSTVELSPGTFLSLWYDRQGREEAFLRLARWNLA